MASTVAASARITASSTIYAAATHISTGSRKVISKGAIRARAFQMGRAHSSKGEFSCRAAADAVMDADEPPAAEVPADEPFVLEGEIDVEEMLAASTFPIKPDALILKAKKFLASDFGVKDPDAVSEDFRFVAPVVGPLDKKTFLEAFGSFKIKEAFPDFNVQYHDFRVDPFEPNRVWLTVRGRGTNTGKFANSIPATNKEVINPPQAVSVTFNEQGLVTKYTIGYVMDKEVGNTGGLGGVYGILYAINPSLLLFPEAQPWTPSPQYQFFMATSGPAAELIKTGAQFVEDSGLAKIAEDIGLTKALGGFLDGEKKK